VFNAPGKRGRKHADDLRTVVEAMLYIAQTGCQWRYLPESFGPWTRVWSQFRRWSRNGTWAQALTALHAAARESDGRAERTPSLVVIDTHLARGASNGGLTFHDRGGPYGRTKGAKRVVAVDVTGLPVAALRLRRRGPPGRVGRQAAHLPAHPARLACRGRPRPLSPLGEVVREHHLGDRLAPGRLHRHYAAPPVPRGGPPAPSGIRSLNGHPPEARGMRLPTADRNRQVRGPWRLRRRTRTVMVELYVS
jgi:transposase